jgi:glycerol-3-phosphate dehydrogenase (NAD(P)+)
VRTTKAAYQLAKKYDVNMPITFALYDVLFNGKNAIDAVDVLMARGKTHEMEDLVNVLEERFNED